MIAQADAYHIPLASGSVHCCVTSPPYWGLRKYAGDQGEEPLGLEPTPERHVERIVEICREVRRVLRDDGVFWINYGDCYASSVNGRAAADIENDDRTFRDKPFSTAQFAKAGSLMMMPHRVALALQADGWIVRQDLVWYKRNPMPESVNGWRWQRERTKTGTARAEGEKFRNSGRFIQQDGAVSDEHYADPYEIPEYEYGDDFELRKGSWRHTRAHEYVFQLVKGPKMKYWSNQEAVRETQSFETIRRAGFTRKQGKKNKDGDAKTNRSSSSFVDGSSRIVAGGRNPRSVVDIPTAPYKGAHYATFPPNLIAPLIRATCPRWACPVCGQGWAAVVEQSRTEPTNNMSAERAAKREANDDATWVMPERYETTSSVLGYRPTCEHPHTQEEAVPGIVFDPFVGSGTTVKVAQDLLRHGIGIDISMEYLDLQAKLRTKTGTPSNQFDNLPLFE